MKASDFNHLMHPRAASLFAKITGKSKIADPLRVAADLVADPDAVIAAYPDLAPVVAYLNRPVLRDTPVPYTVTAPYLDAGSHDQMTAACKLPIAVRGALMPDAHQGYGLPIGGVLATDNAVIPYGVGVDIGCSMRLTIFREPDTEIERNFPRLCQVLEQCTGFGAKGELEARVDHDVLEDPRWQATKLLRGLHDRARKQLGTSGSGNHFVEFGTAEYQGRNVLALLSHSGSRGPGAAVADYYTKIAMDLHPEMGKLAWLSLDSQEGQEYWDAMELMGDFARACHETIHRVLAKATGYRAEHAFFNAHNLAWRERHGGSDVIVHRKGATPAWKGQMGIIPGSMATPAYLVEGLGDEDSLCSASHGAGRRSSRTQSLRDYDAKAVKELMEASGVKLLSGGKDENPFAYKDIREVIAHQDGRLVQVRGVFRPRIVKMAPEEEKKRWDRAKKSGIVTD